MNQYRNGESLITNDDNANAAKSPEIIARMEEARRLFGNLEIMKYQQPEVIMASLPRGYSWNMFDVAFTGFLPAIDSPTFHQTLPAIEAWLGKVYPGKSASHE